MKNPFENAMAQLDKVAQIKNLGNLFDSNFFARLREPDRDIRISIPVKMDDGAMKIFEGYRVQYNNTLGPYKGGLRYHPETEINEVKALGFWMVLKCAVAGIPMGGGKGGITVDPTKLSKGELERLTRGWTQRLSDILGPQKDVPAPDVNTTPEIMGWIADEYGKLTGDKTGAVVTGKPLGQGGSEGRNTATAQGGFYVFETLRAEVGLPQKCTVAIQGFGNVGSNAALIWQKAGHTIIAVSETQGGIYNQNGLDIPKLLEYKKKNGTIAGFSKEDSESKDITNRELLAMECDLLIPAAFEGQLTKDSAGDIKAKVILELANGPTTPEADEILFQKNIPLIPDILANAGGVIVSSFEWEQNLKNEHWSEKEVFDKLRAKLENSSRKMLEKSKESNVSMRMGAFILALLRIKEKMV